MQRKRAWLLMLAGLLAAVAMAVGAWLLGSSRELELAPARVPQHPEVERITIDDPGQHWPRAGFVEMVPPIHLPSSSAELDDVEIWLWLPERGEIVTGVDGALRFPAGTIADRVEWRGAGDRRAIADVRGARIDAQGREWLHTLRRTSSDPRASLFGYEWPRDDPSAHADATASLLDELGRIEPGSKMSVERRDQYLANIRRKNECVGCHQYERPANRREGEHGVVNRGTDASGWFTPATVLADELPLESYGDVDRNLTSNYVTLRCADGQAPTRETRGKRDKASCEDRAVVLARYDLKRALLAGEPRAARVCASREQLYARLDGEGQRRFAQAIEICR